MLRGSHVNYKQQVIELIEKFGRLTLKDLKMQYQKQYCAEIPFADIGNDEVFHEWLINIGRVSMERRNGERTYRVQRHEPQNGSKRIASSPLPNQNSTVKRSRSVPSKEDDKENESMLTPNGGNRQSRSVKFQQDPRIANSNSITSTPRSKSENRPSKDIIGTPNMFGSILIGDDFLLGIAMFQLRYRSKKVDGLLQSGLCVSGQTIAGATRRIKDYQVNNARSAIIYIGSMDIINGRELIQMMNDFNNLMMVCGEKKIAPILCTLAPLPSHQLNNRKITLKGFNEYLISNTYNLPVIDINKAFINADNTSNDACYTHLARPVSGSKSQFSLWSKYGRQRFEDMILKNIGFAYLSSASGEPKKLDFI